MHYSKINIHSFTLFCGSTVNSTCADEIDLAEQLLTVDGGATAHDPGVGTCVLHVIGHLQCRAVGHGDDRSKLLESIVHHIMAILMEWNVAPLCDALTY